jgi:vacuolar-type H+-ATPase subunit I/STV1
MSPTEIVRLLSSLVTALKEYKDSLPENKDTVEPGYTDPEIEAITQQVNTLWDYAHTQYPHFFRSGQESDAEFVKRMNSLLQRREKLLQSLTIDTDADTMSNIKDELASIQTTLDANGERYKEVNDAVYDVKNEVDITEKLLNYPKEKYDAPNFREVEATFNENNKILKSLAASMSSEKEKEFPDPLKLEELREKWHNIYDTGYAKEYSDQLVEQGLIKQENVAFFRQQVTKDIDKLVSMVAKKLFKVHMEGESYMLIDRLGEIFHEYYAIREKLSKDKQNKAIFEETDWEWATRPVSRAGRPAITNLCQWLDQAVTVATNGIIAPFPDVAVHEIVCVL